MKKYILFCLSLLLSVSATYSQTREKRQVLYASSKGGAAQVIQPGESFSRQVAFEQSGMPTRKYVRVIGGVQMPAPFQKRGEELFRSSEYDIEDNLDSIVRKNDRYSLYFKGEDDPFERHAYYRVSGSKLQAGKLTVKLPVVKREALALGDGGDFGIEMELFYKKEGRAADDIYDRPDSILHLPMPMGTYKYKLLSRNFVLPDNVACILLRIGGTHFSGECWVEAPRLLQNGKEVCPMPFTRFAQRPDRHDYWVGVNLATRSWPVWKLELNGKTLYQEPVFDRASNVTDFYIPLPPSVGKEQGELRLTLVKEPHRLNYPYDLRGVEIIEESARDFEVISAPRYLASNAAFGLLVETNRPNMHLQVKAEGAVSPAEQRCYFEQPGLHVVEMRAGASGGRVKFTLTDGVRTENFADCQVMEKESESIYLSSGDEVYIDKEYAPYDYFFKWYLSSRVGNWYHFRPSYQWSGVRMTKPDVVKHYTQLLSRLNMPYAWQVEGRTLAGSCLNPSHEVLASPLFKGKQAHENDGGYYYWGHFKYLGLFSDMAARNRPFGGIFAKHRPIYTDHGVFIHYDPEGVTDMADGARKLVNNLRYSKGESVRHTGPSTLFRYFYQAGYEWVGAEQMYGPEELILSSLRGASRAYDRKHYGSLHAMQWGSFPFTDPKHSLRLYMSLATAYMHGSSHMNTEEALWIDEYANDRYSESGKQHLQAQHRMLDFIETHSRRGELMSNIAVIQGRNDAWKSFGRGSLWSQKGDKWKFNKACESFDLLKVFYPDHIVNSCGPDGWFTSTPYGTVDLLPVEAPQEVMNRYKALIFLGWNSYDETDFGHIRDYVLQGGTLLLSAAHLNEELQPDKPVRFPQKDALLREMLGEDYQKLAVKTEIGYGKGRIVYFPQKAYPAEEVLRSEYTASMKEIASQSVARELDKGWVEAAPSVGFTVWDCADRRTVYLMNTDWKSDASEQSATWVCQSKEFPVAVRRYHLETIHCMDGLALMPEANTTDVLSIEKVNQGWKVKVQTTGKDNVKCMNALSGTSQTLTFGEAGVHVVWVN